MKKGYFMRVMLLTLGNIIAAMGVSFCALAGKGVDPLTVLYQGVCNVTGFEIGVVSFLVNVLMLILCLMLDKTSIKSGTIISMTTFSVFLNFFIGNMGELGIINTNYFSWVILVIGIVLMGIGFSTCIFAGIGPNCVDVILNILMSKTKLNMKICKTLVDFINTAIGVVLGATFGVGTIMCVIFIGVVYSCNMRFLQKISLYIQKRATFGKIFSPDKALVLNKSKY